MSNIITMLIPFLIFSLMNCWTVYLGKKSFGISLPVTFIFSVLLTYFGQLIFHTFTLGIGFCFVAAVCAVGLLIYRRKDKDFLERVFSGGFFVFLIIYLFFFILDIRRHFSSWDELSHWGKMVKEMLRTDRFYSEPQSDLLVHKEYPPFVTIFEMIWCRLTLGYSEARVTMALHILEFSMLIVPVLEKVGFKQPKRKSKRVKTRDTRQWIEMILCIVIWITVFVMAVLNFEYVEFRTIYTDLFMPMFYTAVIVWTMDREFRQSNFGFIMILLGQAGLIISKQMCIAFVLLIWLYYTILEVWQTDWKRHTQIKYRILAGVKSIAVLAVPLANYVIWSKYTAGIGLTGQFDLGKITFSSVINVLNGGGTEVQNRTLIAYKRALWSVDICTGWLKLSYIAAVILAFGGLGAIWYYGRKVITAREMVPFAVLFTVGSAGYAFTMLILYMFCYSEVEMLRLASYQRYMCSYVLSEYLILLVLLIVVLDRKKAVILGFRQAVTALGIGFVTLVGTQELNCLKPQIDGAEPLFDFRYGASVIQENTSDGANIFLVSSNNCRNMYYLNYYLNDRRMDDRYLYSDVAEESAESTDYWENVVACMKEDDYVYVYNSSDNVDIALGEYTAEGRLDWNTLYRVDVNDDSGIMQLVKEN